MELKVKLDYKTRTAYLSAVADKEPIYAGCTASANGGCFCTGACKKIVGWREKNDDLFPFPFKQAPKEQ